jgi:carbonic anhydrase
MFTDCSAANAPLNDNKSQKENKNIKILTRKGENEITKDGKEKELCNKHMHKPINISLIV